VKDERGTALLEMVVLGFAVVALAVPLFLSVAAFSDARARADLTATDAALWIARHGTMPPEEWNDVDLTVEQAGDVVAVRATTTVQMLGVEFASVSATVGIDRTAWMSPYRSGR